MVLPKVFVQFILLTLAAQLSLCTTHSTYHIFPICPDDTECHTLLDAVNEQEKYFATNTTLVLHPGDHNLHQRSLTLASISGLTIMSCGNCTGSNYSSTRIQCTGTDPSFSFFDVSDLRIVAISFVSCKAEFYSTQAEILLSRFENGVSDSGGAIAMYSGSNLRISGESAFVSNRAQSKGGAVYIVYSDLTISGTTTFFGNTAAFGGAIYAEYGNKFTFEGNTTFLDNHAGNYSSSLKLQSGFGGAIHAERNNRFVFKENTLFCNNTADMAGGSMYALDSNGFIFEGNTTFLDNAAFHGGTVFVWNEIFFSFEGRTTFLGNAASGHGGAVYAWDSNSFTFEGDTAFLNNTAGGNGGAVHAEYSNSLEFDGDTTFLNNAARQNGGAICAVEDNTLRIYGPNFRGDAASCAGRTRNSNSIALVTFAENTAESLGGAITSFTSNTIIICGLTSILQNRAIFGGGFYIGHDSSIIVGGSMEYSHNSAIFGGGIFVISGHVTMNSFPGGTFSNNTALGHLPGTVLTNVNSAPENGFGGAVHAIDSTLNLYGSYLITNNTAVYGGGFAISSLEGSTLDLDERVTLHFIGNTARSKGGAIHVEDNRFTYCISAKEAIKIPCFFHTSQVSWRVAWEALSELRVNFINNTAQDSGDTLYGGELEECNTNIHYDDYKPVQGSALFQMVTNNDEGLEISSDPFKVCICENGIPKCDQRSANYQRYPGQTLSIDVLAVGQMDGVVPSVIRAVPTGLNLTSEYTTQPTVSRQCSELRYPVLPNTAARTTALSLYCDEPCFTSGVNFDVNVAILPCPPGFALSEQQCTCEFRLREYTEDCHIEDETITRREISTFWVGLDHDKISESGLILHPHCPFDYCTDEAVSFKMNETDTQCQEGRSGVLCGACKSGYSLALGSSRCIPDCSDTFLALLFAFAAGGVALVLLLLACNLTVASGTLSGLIFYANILAINQSVFFPSSDPNISTNVLTVFVAWLNLDLGIETCFFTSMDIYIRTWLQFAFPLYVWVLVGVTVFLAHYSTTVARFLTGTNPVAVLATLFLLSYTKLLRAIMVAFSFTTLGYPDNETKVVWLYDGNVEYGEVKHLILLLVSLLFLLSLFLPYTLLLLCGQWIQRHAQLKCFSPARHLYIQAIFDAYNAPYKNRHRYWTGLLLVVRFLVLLLSTAINIGSPQDPHTNLLVIIILLSGLLAWVSHGVHTKWYIDILESLFIFNLIVLCAGTYQVRQSMGSQAALVYTSVSVAFITFITIVVASVIQHVRESRFGKSFVQQMKSMKRSNETVNNDLQEERTETPRAPAVSTTVVKIDKNQQSDSANYRETVIELM